MVCIAPKNAIPNISVFFIIIKAVSNSLFSNLPYYLPEEL